MLIIVLAGVALRLDGLFTNTFHADEALFATWARYIAVWRDPMLLNTATPIDKPPLLFYSQALFYPLQGPVEWAARLPNFFASVLLIPLVGRIAFDITGHHVKRAWLAAAVVAFSPISIQFSATAFTDPLLTFWITLALWSGLNQSRKPAGLWLGLAFLTKYQAILFLPLILWLERSHPAKLKKSLAWFAMCIAALLVWDWAPNGQIDLFGRQLSAYGGIGLSDSVAFIAQLDRWVSHFPHLLGWGLTGLILVWLASLWFQSGKNRFQQTGLVFASYAAGYVVLHLVIVNLSEPRYSLPLLPLLAVAIATLPALTIHTPQTSFPGASLLPTILLGLCLILPAIPAASGQYPFGGRPENDAGASRIAQTLIHEPYGTVLYDHEYSWHWRYHFFYKGVHVEWFENPADLLENLTAFFDPNSPDKRFIALKSNDPMTISVKGLLSEHGYRLEPAANEGKIELYLITGN